ncbi:MAG: AI-2E family transporter [Bacillota bacterium]
MVQIQRSWLVRLSGALLAVLLLTTIYYLRGVIVAVVAPLLAAIFIAYLINPSVVSLERRGMSRNWAILSVYTFFTAVITTAGTYLIPTLIRELTKLAATVPLYAQQVSAWYWSMKGNVPDAVNRFVEQNVQRLQMVVSTTAQDLIQAILSALGLAVYLVIIPIMSYYLLRDSAVLWQSFLDIIPRKNRKRVVGLVSDIQETLGCWVRGQVTVCALVGLLTSIGLWLIGLGEFALLLGVLAGVSDFIPYFGPIIGGAPAVLFGLLRGPGMAIKAVIVILAVQQIENSVLSPMILGHELGLHPISIMLGLIAGGKLGGLWGMILAVPTMAITKVLLHHWIRSRSELT